MPFADVVGHRGPIALLTRAIARGTIPPTLLFAGPAGVGKWQVARALAAAVNCPSLVEGDACGHCRSCDRVARDVHVDVVTLEADDTGKIKLEPVRKALGDADFRPFEGQRRVVLIRDAETLREEAQHALLKSLEEPPPATLFVLTSAAPDALLRTVRSRTMRLSFGRLGLDDLERVLTRDHRRAADEARRVAMFADGSVGAALAMGSTTLGDVRDAATALLRASTAGDLAARIAIAKTVVGEKKPERSRQEMQAVLHMAASIVRDVAALQSGVGARLLANGDIAPQLQNLAQAMPPAAARHAFSAVHRGLAALAGNAGPKLVAEWLCAEI